MNDLLTLGDAVKVCLEFLRDYSDTDPDEMKELVEQEMEQKCWISEQNGKPLKRLNDLTFDINPAEIASQIESDNLRNWCKTIQVEMRMAMVELPLR